MKRDLQYKSIRIANLIEKEAQVLEELKHIMLK